MDIERACAIDGWMDEGELRWLALNALGRQTIVEVGSHKGRSTRVLGDYCEGHVVAVDTWGSFDGVVELVPDEFYEEFMRNMGDLIASHRVFPFRANSQEAAKTIPAGVDMVFLDGDHSYEGCLADIRAYRALLRPGGLLCGHDYSNTWHPGVRQAVDASFVPQLAELSIWWIHV